ncbi:hypothetical protein GWR56_16665 [Mucilaginibacter sp. 14171R-50]|uniref:hypothetical protein n=1 Tax=Mucilaginibacter sp. 14171R-50 TaxID=2703789 RepID=UPI00138BBCBF|nr:hypothetical protein [Mucilaginibacter sp. 14171R-50]QHS57089.1 hypothetical protein GWR56_16665 [Mucilaginibacter sp. 14171R-50]
MKKICLPLMLLGMLCLSSCVDIEERYDFKPSGACNVVYGFDMSKAVSVLMNLMTDSVRETPQFGMVKDTTLNFYSALPDSISQKMNAEEMKMAQGSELAVKMDLKNNIMKVSIKHEAKNAADLRYYLQHLSSISMNSQLNNVTNNDKVKAFDTQPLITGQSYYNYEITDHKFYRVIDKDKFNAFLKKAGSKFAMAKAMLIDMPYKVILNFARPVKKVNNSKAVLSADRRQVTLITSMDEVMKNPALMNLKIDF